MSVVLASANIPKGMSSWQVPEFTTSPEYRQGWVEEQILEGEGTLSGQRSYKNLGPNMSLFDGIYADQTKSTLCSNFLKYNIRKFVETLADIREIGTFGSDAVQYKSYAEILNNVAKCIYTESAYPRQLRKALQWASVTGVGYLWPQCIARDYGWGERRIEFEPLGLLDVLSVQTPSSNDVADCYAQTIFKYMPIAEAHARFPMYQSALLPVDKMSYPSRLTAKRVDWNERYKYGDSGSVNRNWGSLYCEIRYTFVRDLRVNNTGYELPMGDAGTSWFYRVPYVGQQIFGGVRNGQPFMREAIAEDCRIYPNLRLIISTRSMKTPMYDGPAFDWHGQMPAIQYTVDDWPWEALGLSLVEDVGSIERTKRKIERKMDQVITTRLNPPMGYDRTATGGPKIENFDLFAENVRMGVDGQPAQTFQSILPETVAVDEVHFQWRELLKAMEEQELGINDLGNLMNMRLNMGADGMDKVLESVGPVAKGIAASMEASNARVAYMLKFMIPQWMDTKRIIEYIGPDKVTPMVMDFDPEAMIPSHGEDEYVNGLLPVRVIGPEQILAIPSNYDKMQRARMFARAIRLISIPSTLLKITQLEEQTKYLALYGRGFPIAPHDVAKKLNIENYGDIAGQNAFERWVNWKKLELLLMLQAQQTASALMPEPPGDQGPDGGSENAAGASGASDSPTKPPVHAGGRPPTDQRPGHLEIKDKHTANPRPVVRTSP